MYSLLADALIIIHFLFILFVVTGGLLILQHSVREAAPDAGPRLVMTGRRGYGDTRLSFFQKQSDRAGAS